MTKTTDCIFLVMLAIIAAGGALFSKNSLIISVILFFGLPSLYLAIRIPKTIGYAALGALIIGLLGGLIVDAWLVRNQQLVWTAGSFAEKAVYYFLWVFMLLIIFERLGAQRQITGISRSFAKTLPAIAGGIIIFLFLFTGNSDKFFGLSMEYAYLALLIAGVMFSYIMIAIRPAVFRQIFLIVPIIIFTHILYEFVAIKRGLWAFPGVYIGNVNLLGIRFPIEELIFWIFLSPFFIIYWYELFIVRRDDYS